MGGIKLGALCMSLAPVVPTAGCGMQGEKHPTGSSTPPPPAVESTEHGPPGAPRREDANVWGYGFHLFTAEFVSRALALVNMVN